MHSAPSICRNAATSSLAPMVARPISLELRHDGIARRSRRRCSAIDLTDLLDQAGVVVGDADDIGAVTGGRGTPRHFFEQPGAERIEFAHPGHIDLDGGGAIELRRNVIGQPFERRRIRRRPGPGRTQFERIARLTSRLTEVRSPR